MLNAANTAFQNGDLRTAEGLYQRVTNTPPAPTESATASAALTQVAHFRAMVSFLADGRESDALTERDALLERDANAPLTRLASQVWDQYGMTGQIRAACAQIQPQVASQAGAVFTTLQPLGVMNLDASTLCSVPRSGG